MRTWEVTIKEVNESEIKNHIDLMSLRSTVRALKTTGKDFIENSWANPITPLLIEHVFLQNSATLGKILHFTLPTK